MTEEEKQTIIARYMNKPVGVPVWRFYLTMILVAGLSWTAGFFHGKNAEERKDAEITIQSQEKVLETHTEVYSSMPRNRDDAIKWLHDNSR